MGGTRGLAEHARSRVSEADAESIDVGSHSEPSPANLPADMGFLPAVTPVIRMINELNFRLIQEHRGYTGTPWTDGSPTTTGRNI
jgi:hypothetical protein